MIRVGIGGWTYEPWRGLFFPEKLPKTKELNHASRRVTSIEVNGTFYGTFNPKIYRKWFDEPPDDFVFSLKAPRFAVNRRILGEGGPSITKFFESGVNELKSELGPILWQLPPTKKYEAHVLAPGTVSSTPRYVFVYFINSEKERAPAAAEALIHRLNAVGGGRVSRF